MMPKAVILFYHWFLSWVLQHSNNVIFDWGGKKKKRESWISDTVCKIRITESPLEQRE